MKSAIESFKRKNSSIRDSNNEEAQLPPKIAKNDDVELLQLSDDDDRVVASSCQKQLKISKPKMITRKKIMKKPK